MDPVLSTGLKAMVFGMGTVFIGLMVLLGAMHSTTWLLNRPRHAFARRRSGGEDFSQVQTADAPAFMDVAAEDDLPVSAEVIAAIAVALHLDRLALEELNEQRLTWTRMFKPFSPWLMDSKNSLHTHRIRYRATSPTGTIVRERPGRS